MVNAERAEKALDWIHENADALGKARAERTYLDGFIRSKRALLMSASTHERVADKEAEALAHPDYLALLASHRDAVHEEERLRFLMVHAQAVLEHFRTIEASRRAERT